MNLLKKQKKNIQQETIIKVIIVSIKATCSKRKYLLEKNVIHLFKFLCFLTQKLTGDDYLAYSFRYIRKLL